MQKYKMPIRLRIMACLIGMLLPMCMFAQQITVQGVVKDQTGETVIGASVVQKNTTNGTITGIDGDFSLNVPSDAVIVVSFVGYKSLEVPVKGQKQIMVTLSEDSEMLDEVVVIGYGTMKKSDLTGAVSSLGSKDIKDAPVSNLGQAIQGRISGVQADDALSGEGGFAHGGDLLPKVHGGAVPAFAVGLAALEVPGIDQRPGVHHEVGLFQRTQAAQGDEVFRARSGADEFDERSVHDVISFWNVNR